MKPDTIRLLTAVFIAPVALAMIWFLIGLVTGMSPQLAFYMGLYVLIVTLVLGVVIGLPVHFALKSAGQTDLLSYLLAACILAAIPITAAAFSVFRSGDWSVVFVVAAILLPCCLITSGVAWAIARPDRVDHVDTALFE